MITAQRHGIDIIYKINEADVLKTKILHCMALLYENMLPGNSDMDDISDLLGDILLYTFMLGKKIGFDFDVLREEMCQKIRILLINDVREISAEDLNELSQYLGA